MSKVSSWFQKRSCNKVSFNIIFPTFSINVQVFKDKQWVYVYCWIQYTGQSLCCFSSFISYINQAFHTFEQCVIHRIWHRRRQFDLFGYLYLRTEMKNTKRKKIWREIMHLIQSLQAKSGFRRQVWGSESSLDKLFFPLIIYHFTKMLGSLNHFQIYTWH